MTQGSGLNRARSSDSSDESVASSSIHSDSHSTHRNANGYEKVSTQEQSATAPSSASSSTPSSTLPASPAAVIASISFYATVSLGIVYFNWWLFTSAFQYPVFVSWIQQVFGLILFVFFAFLGQRFAIFRHFPFTIPNWDTAKHVLPLSLSFVGMVGLANICLKFVQVSTYQVARSLTIFFTIGLSYIILKEIQKPRIMMSCGVMVIGFIIGSLDTSTLSFAGVLAGGFSSVFQALYNVAIKKTLQYTNNDPNLLLFYNLCWSSVLFIPVIFISGEGSVTSELQFNPSQAGFFPQWGSLLLSGVLATAMNLSSYWCVKVTSPLTFNIVGVTKSVVQSVGGIAFLGDLVSSQSILGIILSLGGSGWYSFIKVQESNAARKPVESTPAYQKLELQQMHSFDIEKALKDELALVNEPLQQQQQQQQQPTVSTSSSSSLSLSSSPSRSGTPPLSRRNIEPVLIGVKTSLPVESPSLGDSNSNYNTSTTASTFSLEYVSSPSDAPASVIRRTQNGGTQSPNDFLESSHHSIHKHHTHHLEVSSPMNSSASSTGRPSSPLPHFSSSNNPKTQSLSLAAFPSANGNQQPPPTNRLVRHDQWLLEDIINDDDKHLLNQYENLQSTSKND